MSKDQIATAYDEFVRLSSEIKNLKKTLSELEREQEVHKSFLLKSIKPNSSKCGVFHKQTETRSIKYAEVVKALKERYIPKTKLPEVEIVIENFTTIGYRDSFELEA